MVATGVDKLWALRVLPSWTRVDVTPTRKNLPLATKCPRPKFAPLGSPPRGQGFPQVNQFQ